jgi:hypothetical protein
MSGSDTTRGPLLTFVLVALSALFFMPIACGKEVSLGSGPASPGDASPDQPQEMQAAGMTDARPDQAADRPAPVGDVRGLPDTPPAAGTDVRPD